MAADQRRAHISKLSVVGLGRLTGIIYPNACTIAAVRRGEGGAGQTCSGSAQTKSTEGSMGAICAGDRRCAILEGGMVIMQAFEQSRLPAAATSQRQSLAALSFGKRVIQLCRTVRVLAFYLRLPPRPAGSEGEPPVAGGSGGYSIHDPNVWA